MWELKHILAAWIVMLSACAPLMAAPKSSNAGTGGTDNYSISFAGTLSGKGNAASAGTTLSITGNITDENGNTGTFTATNLTIDAKLHFTGTGTALGMTVTLSGRLDPAPPQEAALKTQRIVCTFTTKKSGSKEGHGRIAGYVPVTPDSAPIKTEDD